MIQGHLGIDVSKNHLDARLFWDGKKSAALRVTNDSAGYTKLHKWVRVRVTGPVHACMESTGCYSYGPGLSLLEWCEVVSVENPRRIKNFGMALGVVNKTDKIDARIIAEYCVRMVPRPWRLTDPYAQKLLLLVRRLSDLDKIANMEHNRLENVHQPQELIESIRRTHAGIVQERAIVWEQLREHVQSNEKVVRQIRALAMLNGMGELTAVRFLAYVGGPEHYSSAKEVASFCGIFPVQHQSGVYQGRTRMSRSGEPDIRVAFYFPGRIASLKEPDLILLRARLIARGLSKSAAIGACRHKLIKRCYGVLKAIDEGREPTGLNHGKDTRWDLTK